LDMSVGNALSLLSLAFGVWAWVVAWGVATIRRETTNMANAAAETSKTLSEHIHQTERRLTMLETEFKYISRRIRMSDDENDGDSRRNR